MGYRPRHGMRYPGPSGAGLSRPRVTVLGRSLERLTLVRAGLVVVGLGIVAGAFFVPNPGKASAPKPTGIVAHPAAHQGEHHPATTTAGLPAGPNPPARPGRGVAAAPLRAAPSPTTAATLVDWSAPARDVPAPPGLGPALRQAWVAADPGRAGLALAQVRSTAPGSVYVALQPASGTYWAIARFLAAVPVHGAQLAQFAQVAAFERPPGHPWAYLGSSAGPCGAKIPMPVLNAWGLCQSPGS